MTHCQEMTHNKDVLNIWKLRSVGESLHVELKEVERKPRQRVGGNDEECCFDGLILTRRKRNKIYMYTNGGKPLYPHMYTDPCGSGRGGWLSNMRKFLVKLDVSYLSLCSSESLVSIVLCFTRRFFSCRRARENFFTRRTYTFACLE